MGCLVEDEEVSIYYGVAMFHGRNAAYTKERHRESETLQNPLSLLIIPTAGSRFQRSQLHKSPFVNQINSSDYILHTFPTTSGPKQKRDPSNPTMCSPHPLSSNPSTLSMLEMGTASEIRSELSTTSL